MHGAWTGQLFTCAAPPQSIDALSPVERELLARKLDDLEASLEPGFTIFNWTSLGITEFIANCDKAIATFQSLVKQVQKNSSIIEQVVYAIAGAQLVTEPAGARHANSYAESAWAASLGVPVRLDEFGLKGNLLSATDDEVLDLQEFCEAIERQRVSALEALVKKYRTISPLLGKIEEVVAGTNSGKSGALASYYSFWERAIFTALNTMVLSAMNKLQEMIEQRSKHFEGPGGRRPPLFKVGGPSRSTGALHV